MSYIPNTDEDRREMLREIGVSKIEDLFKDIPNEVFLKEDLKLKSPLSELELGREMLSISRKNRDLSSCISFLGAGAYEHFIPSVVNHVISRSEFYSSYTPYQAEISQGILQAIYEYQSMICQLTKLEVANASLYDGATALAEGALLSVGVTGRERIIVSSTVHPEYRRVLHTYAEGLDLKIVEIDYEDGLTDLGTLENALIDDVGAVLVQNPNFFGYIENLHRIERLVHKVGALLVTCVDPISLGILEPPGDYNGDIALGEGQGLGNQLSFGGPYVGFFAAKREYMRRIPGRVVGATVDKEGNGGFVLTLQTREQHIRRERATSNICTNHSLNALASAVYMSALGPQGLRRVGLLSLQKAHYAFKELCKISGVKARFKGYFFKEFVLDLPIPPSELNRRLLKRGIIGGFELGRFYPELKDSMLLCVTEMRTKEEIDLLVRSIDEII